MLSEGVSTHAVRHFCQIALRRLGIEMAPKMEALVAGRLAKRMKVLQVPLEEYLTRLEGDEECDEVVGFLDLMRTPARGFYDPWADYAALYAQIRRWLSADRRRFRLWSAGCGTGEEAYAMTMTALNAIESAQIDLKTVDLKVLATDLSPRMLDRGKKGTFDQEQIKNVPHRLRERYFREEGERLCVLQEVRSRVVFRRLNLARPPFPMTGPLDAIFCHEGLLPLLPSIRAKALQAAKRLLAEHGVLATGFEEGMEWDEGDEDMWSDARTRDVPRSGHC